MENDEPWASNKITTWTTLQFFQHYSKTSFSATIVLDHLEI